MCSSLRLNMSPGKVTWNTGQELDCRNLQGCSLTTKSPLQLPKVDSQHQLSSFPCNKAGTRLGALLTTICKPALQRASSQAKIKCSQETSLPLIGAFPSFLQIPDTQFQETATLASLRAGSTALPLLYLLPWSLLCSLLHQQTQE